MLIRCSLLLAVLSCVQPKVYDPAMKLHFDNDVDKFALWPSVHNAAALLRTRRASNSIPSESGANQQGASEGVGDIHLPADSPTDHADTKTQSKDTETNPTKQNDQEKKQTVDNAAKQHIESEPSKQPEQGVQNVPDKDSTLMSNETPKDKSANATVSSTPVVIKDNGTTAEKTTKDWDLTPEATKRGLIVFGGFALLAMAYFIFYRTKTKYNESNNPNNTNESNQFRYGVLQSEDRRDNLELSRVPLTMESDDEEDEDLEIFDLEQKKKSLSYVNLQGTDEDIVLSQRSNTGEQLLLDIEDENNDTLINWTNSGSKALL